MDSNLMQAFLRPWMMEPRTVGKLAAILHRHSQGVKLSAEEVRSIVEKRDAELSARNASAARIKAAAERPYELYENGTAVIPITGVIAKRSSQVMGISGPQGVSVEQIRRGMDQALADASVARIVLAIDSPGGSVDGIADLADQIHASRAKKEIVAFADGQMCSAAYFIGSAASRIVAAQDSAIGSIGVYCILEDWSKYLEEYGLKEEMIKAGKFKGYGHSDFPITDDTRKLVQEEVDAYYTQFVNAVAKQRGFSTERALALGDGRIHIGAAAKEVGLVDEIGTFESVIGRGSGRIQSTRPLGRERQKPMEKDTLLLADCTFNDVVTLRPDIKDYFARNALADDKNRRSEISKLINGSGLSESVQGHLALTCVDMSLDDAKNSIDRTTAIEGALASAKLAGCTDEDLDCLRADVRDMPKLSAVNAIANVVNAKKGQQERLIKGKDGAIDGKDVEQKPNAEGEKLAAAIKDARADYAANKNQFIGLAEKDFVMVRLDRLGIKATDEQVEKLLK